MKNFNLINVQMAKVAVVIFAFSCMLAFTSCSEEYKAKKCVKEFVEASIKKDKKVCDSIYPGVFRDANVRHKFTSDEEVGEVEKDSTSFIVPVGKCVFYVEQRSDKTYRIEDSRNYYQYKPKDSEWLSLAKKIGAYKDVDTSGLTDNEAEAKIQKNINKWETIAWSNGVQHFLLKKYPQAETMGAKLIFSKKNLLGHWCFDATVQAGNDYVSEAYVKVSAFDANGNIVTIRTSRDINLSPHEVVTPHIRMIDDTAYLIRKIEAILVVDEPLWYKLANTSGIQLTGNEYQEYLNNKKQK